MTFNLTCDAKSLAEILINDINTLSNTNSYGEYTSEYHEFITYGEMNQSICAQITKVEDDDYYHYSVHISGWESECDSVYVTNGIAKKQLIELLISVISDIMTELLEHKKVKQQEEQRNFTIRIDDEVNDDGTFDVEVYEEFDEDSERDDELSVCEIKTLDEAKITVCNIIENNPQYKFEYLGLSKR